jgi:hypothetical protein
MLAALVLDFVTNLLLQGIFGMEFFELDKDSHLIKSSPQIWIYFLTAVGATIFTMALYCVMAGLPQIRREQNGTIKKAEDDDIPCTIQRGCTDIEKNARANSDIGWTEKVLRSRD